MADAPEEIKLPANSKALLRASSQKAKNNGLYEPDWFSKLEMYDPIEEALGNHPTLTREEAEEMARAFGF
jgi:hypothetical protein